jgi:hypothetical protein
VIAVEEAQHVLVRAGHDRRAGPLIDGLSPLRGHRRRAVGGQVGEHQEAARRARIPQPRDGAVGVGVVREEVQDRHQQDCDRLGEVDRPAHLGMVEQLLRSGVHLAWPLLLRGRSWP